MAEQIVIEVESRPTVAEVEVSTGMQGPPGPITDLTVGTVTTGAPGTPAIVTITGTAPSKVINFTIPQAAGGVINSVNGQFGPDVIIGAEDITTGVFDIDVLPVGTGAADVAAGNHTHTPNQVGLGNVDNTADVNKPVSAAQQAALSLKANVDSPTFTGTVTGVTKAHVGLSNVDNTSDVAKPISAATQTALNLKAPLASPTFTGTVSGITKSMVGLGNVPNVDTTNANNITSGTIENARLSSRLGVYARSVTDWNNAVENGWYMGSGTTNAPNADTGWWIGEVVAHNNLYITQTVWQFTGATSANTMAYRRRMNNNVWEGWYKLSLSQAEQDARYAMLSGNQTITGVKTFTSAPVVPTNSFSISSTSGLQAALDLKAPLANPAFTGTVTGITKSMVGLSNVDNTADADKPISTAVSTALAGKASTSHVHDYTTLTNRPTLGTAAAYNIPASGNANTVQVVIGSDTRLTDARVALSHVHPISEVTNLQEALSLRSLTTHTHTFDDGAGATLLGVVPISQLPTGTTVGTVALGNHTHTAAEVGAATMTDVNDASAFARARANHTGTQPASTITGLAAIATSGSASDITTGTLPVSVLPSMAITTTTVVASEAEMLALSAQTGDVAIRTDANETYILSGNDPTVLSNWTEILAGGASVTSVAGKTGVVTLVKADVGLGNVDNTSDANKPVSTATQTALNTKVGLSGTETIAGTKTFSSAPVVPDSSFTVAKTSGLQSALDGKQATIAAGTTAQYWRGDKTWQTLNAVTVDLTTAQTIGGIKTFSSAPVVPDNSFAIAKVNGLTTELNNRALATQVGRRYSFEPGSTGGTRRWVRLLTIDGVSTNSGGFANFWLTGTGDHGDADRGTILVHTGQRNDNLFNIKAWAFGVDATQDPVELYYKQISTFVFEVWAKFADYNQTHELYMLASKNATVNLDNIGTTAPTTPVLVPLTKVAEDETLVHLTGNETVAGEKTFSSAPVVPDNSFAIAKTSGLQTALDGKAATVHGHALTDANITGVLPIAQIPTGTTSTTVALGNHLHTGVYEPAFATGTTSQYRRGDKTWQTLDKAAVGLGNIDNTSDANKPVSTAQQTALNLKANLASPTFTGTVTAPTFSGSGASLTSLNASNLSTGTVPQARTTPNSQKFYFTTGNEARPTNTSYVEWIGPVTPVNATAEDVWINTALESSQQLAVGFPITSTIPYAGQLTPPSGWAMAEGGELPIATYTECYNNLTNNGTSFPYGANTNGAGAAGSTHFRLPSLTTRVPVGYGTLYTETNAIGKTGGNPTEALDINKIPSHNHGGTTTGADGNHTHSGTTGVDNQDHSHQQVVGANSGGPGVRSDYTGDISSNAYPQGLNTHGRSNYHDHNFTTGYSNQGGHQHTIPSQGNGTAPTHNNMQPYIVMRYIIRVL